MHPVTVARPLPAGHTVLHLSGQPGPHVTVLGPGL